jgi:choline dehydrogenase
MQGTDMDWSLKSVSQQYSSYGLKDNQQSLPRGKGLGGSHQLNYLLHFDGLEKDFDEWKRLGSDGWDYNNLHKLLSRHETDENGCSSSGNECQLDDDNPKLSIKTVKKKDSKLAEIFLKSENELQKGFHPNVTFDLAKYTTRKGIRHSVFHEYLRRAYKHKNLSIMVHAKVEKIEFNEDKEAISVIVNTKSDSTARVYAKREIVLSAGAIHSPHILKLSGVGDKGELKSVGINLLHHSAGVGENLFDHMNFPLFVSINETVSVTRNKVLSTGEIYRYLIDGEGILSTTGVVGMGRLNDYGLIFFGVGTTDEEMLKHIANYESETFRAFFPLHANLSQEGFVALSTCLLPHSRGSIKIDSKNIYSNPLIDPQYLSNDYDMACMRNAIRLVIEMISTKAFQQLKAKIHWPKLKLCQNFGPFEDVANFSPSDRYLDCILRNGALTGHHPGGTCAVGSVVDNDLR